jgi:sporulation and cell division protein SsgA
VLTTVDQSLQGRLILDPTRSRPLAAHLRYRRDDPIAVHLSFPAAVSLEGGDVEWVFARELLDRGLHGPSGDGDVHIWPCGPGRTMIEFSSSQGTALIEFPADDLRNFLRWAYASVPVGQESAYLDLDTAIEELLDGA